MNIFIEEARPDSMMKVTEGIEETEK